MMKSLRHYIESIFNAFKKLNLTIVCRIILANLYLLKPGSSSNHFFEFNNSSSTSARTWIFSALSCMVVHLFEKEFWGIDQISSRTIIRQVILTVAVICVTYILSKWDCEVEVAKFIGCFNVKTETHGKRWIERCEIYKNHIKLSKNVSLSFALALLDTIGPLAAYLSIDFILFASYYSPIPFSPLKVVSGIFLFSIIWVFWLMIYFFSFRWIGRLVFQHYIFKERPDLKTNGYTLLWKVFVKKPEVAGTPFYK